MRLKRLMAICILQEMSHPPNFGAALSGPPTLIHGVGEERAALLGRLKITTVQDLLLHPPRRYEDRRHFLSICDLRLEEPATVRGRIQAAGIKSFKRGSRRMFEMVLDDGSGRLHCRWWQAQSWMETWYVPGREFLVFGRLNRLKPRTMDHPETEWCEPGDDEFIHANRIVPIHPLTEGLSSRVLRTLVWNALEQFEKDVAEPTIHPDLKLYPSRANAIRMIHFPNEPADVEVARQRLALDEFVKLQSQIQGRRRRFQEQARGLPCAGNNQLMRPFLSGLPFSLTSSQTRVLREIRTDMGGPYPMRRLLQGDVGCGKTVVAACAALMALESGFNVAIMAPTEILAVQHYHQFSQWLKPLGMEVSLQTGSASGKNVESPPAHPPQSAPIPPSVTVGTHALLTARIELRNLGLVIIDEQHKFGVAQRESLVRKGHFPHLLVMTATPIPRTLGLTLYGDLDLSVMERGPGGRGNIKTHVRGSDKLARVFEFVRGRMTEGRQAYIIYPRVQASEEDGDVKAVTREFQKIQEAMAPFKAGLLHGSLTTREKEEVMAAFRENRVQALVATSLVEVGVDVPNATVMVVENAEQFGLAQLHQLRGRVGRGSHESHCILISNSLSDSAKARLDILAKTTDGFQIAEEDLKMRGPGELLGQQQSGLPELIFGNLATDMNLIHQARNLVMQEKPESIRVLDNSKAGQVSGKA